MTSNARTCTNGDCNFAVDGKCVEGYDVEECPHVSKISVTEIEEVQEAEAPRNQPAAVMTLSLGEALDRAAASSLQRCRISRAVGIVGPNDAGKTSLIASVYDLLQEGPIAEVGFAGSSTLIGFEKICHDARAASRREAPHMARTSAGADATFFHIDLRPSGREIISLFIGDRSGEDYLGAADDLSRAQDFFELRRADTVTLLVNGEQLASSENRHEVKAITPQIVDALVEAGSFRRGCRLAVVLTKNDTVLASPHADRVRREFDAIVDAIVQSHEEYLGDINRFVVAASPRDSTKVKRGEGVDELLLFWLRAAPSPVPIQLTPPDSSRMIDLLDSRSEVPE
jgi:hypothetical protein